MLGVPPAGISMAMHVTNDLQRTAARSRWIVELHGVSGFLRWLLGPEPVSRRFGPLSGFLS